jgi:hypothetical protein
MIPPIRVIDGEEYYVVPVHPDWLRLIRAAGVKLYAERMGIKLVEMTDEEMELKS